MNDTIDRIIVSSRPTDADIDAEFSPAAQARILDDVVSFGSAVELARPRPRRWAVLVAAGVTIAVGGLAIQAVAPPRTTSVVTQGPNGPVTTTVTQPPIGLSAAAALEPVARTAAALPALTPTGTGLLHVVMTETQNGHTVTHDTYVDADGWTWRKDTEAGRGTAWLLYDAQPDDYATLPTEPAALDAVLRQGTGNNSADERVFHAIEGILRSQTASPAVKAAAIRVLAAISERPQAPTTTKDGTRASPAISLTGATMNGTQVIRATQTDPTSRPGISFTIVLDAATGELVATESTAPDRTFAGVVEMRALVNALPADFVTALGTERVHRETQK